MQSYVAAFRRLRTPSRAPPPSVARLPAPPECTPDCPLCAPLQATVSGFRLVTRENVFRVCDQPHPLLVAQIVESCGKAELYKAYEGMKVSGGTAEVRG